MGTLAVPVSGRVIAAEELLSPGDLAHKQKLADMALDAAKRPAQAMPTRGWAVI
jgi:hypothetical protein